jgi:hypothetical protein
MSTITIPRAVVEQAMEALEAMNPYPASREDQRAGALAALRAALAQPEPNWVQRPATCRARRKNRFTGTWGKWLIDPPLDFFDTVQCESVADEWEVQMLYTDPLEQAPVLLQALQTLVSVCQRMDLEHQAERPSEAEYQAAVQAAQGAIQAVEGAA